jgi:hypothetical protein
LSSPSRMRVFSIASMDASSGSNHITGSPVILVAKKTMVKTTHNVITALEILLTKKAIFSHPFGVKK